jgi:pimeloyl-ACP methyl ester carboxylesterase
MTHVTSSDGTPIAYHRQGSGAAVILVTGGLDDGAENAPLATELAGRFTAYNYNRRGRGQSGDAPPSTIERELEDLDALIGEAGGSAHLYGVSSGGALALEAAAAGLAIERLAVYEVPYAIGDEAARRWRDYVERLEPALAEGRRGEALELFMRLAGSTDEEIARARSSPHWAEGEGLAHTLAYEAVVLGDGRPPTARLEAVTQPALVATGGGNEFFELAADAIAAGVPHAERITVPGQGHVADPKAIAAVLARFFAA